MGLKSGVLAVVDCAKCAIVKKAPLQSNLDAPINWISFAHKKKEVVFVVAGQNSLIASVSPKICVKETLNSKKH